MQLQSVSIKNFRLLKNANLTLESGTTVIVGRNNSGKTSLTELFRRVFSDKSPTFRLEDFSLSVHEQFLDAFRLKCQGRGDEETRSALPFIEVVLMVGYEKDLPTLGPLSEFIVDLDPNCTQAKIIIRSQLKTGGIEALFEGIPPVIAETTERQKVEFFQTIRDRVSSLFETTLEAADPNDASNTKRIEWTRLQSLVQSGFINAQRGLDDITHRDRDVLGRILEAIFSAANSKSADEEDRIAVKELDDAVKKIQTDIDIDFNEKLKKLLPAFSLFGYPGLSDPRLRTETTLDVQRILTNHTRVRYTGANGVNLPESFNGLGTRNLIYILLQLFEFFKGYKARTVAPAFHIVFIEEPEAHLHPQMQEVFIRQLSNIAETFSRDFNDGQPWPVQFVVSTHSSHVANEASFEAIRYFLAQPNGSSDITCQTEIKDLRKGFAESSPEDRDFLHQYLTLTRCDLFFADKAVLIEGPTERLLLPKIVEKMDKMKPAGNRLSSQYIATIEVGGAYAHRFFKLLKFLNLRAAIITDLDSVKEGAKRFEKCRVSEGTRTSNACLRDWFSADVSPSELIAKSADEKTKGNLRIAYQIPETPDAPCGRSFEDAFIMANSDAFHLAKSSSANEKEQEAWELAKSLKKTDFALEHAIDVKEWIAPKYIIEALQWLALSGVSPTGDESSSANSEEVHEENVAEAEAVNA